MTDKTEHWTLEQYQAHLRGEDPENPKPERKVTHWEQQDAKALVELFDLQYPHLSLVFFHIANEASAPIGPKVGGILKAMGQRSGAADYVLLAARHGYNSLVIELKATPPNDSPVTENQKKFLNAARAQGSRAELCRGWAEAWDVIRWYLGE